MYLLPPGAPQEWHNTVSPIIIAPVPYIDINVTYKYKSLLQIELLLVSDELKWLTQLHWLIYFC